MSTRRSRARSLALRLFRFSWRVFRALLIGGAALGPAPPPPPQPYRPPVVKIDESGDDDSEATR